jgi:hypothetical protein
MRSEGLFTTIWGPAQWQSLHNITFNYPYNPTSDDKKKYYDYFIALGNVLPCCTCRDHYNHYIRNGETKLTDRVLSSRDTLTRWMFDLHKSVCNRLGFDYDITYEMFCKKQNSYIAKTDFTREQKMEAYKNLYDVHAPVIKYDILSCLSDYAIERGFNNFLKNIKYYNSLNRESKEWYIRNQKCQEQIKHMRINGISQLTDNGMPSDDELKLMEMCCTTLSKRSIKNILKNMGCKIRKTFTFQKS